MSEASPWIPPVATQPEPGTGDPSKTKDSQLRDANPDLSASCSVQLPEDHDCSSGPGSVGGEAEEAAEAAGAAGERTQRRPASNSVFKLPSLRPCFSASHRGPGGGKTATEGARRGDEEEGGGRGREEIIPGARDVGETIRAGHPEGETGQKNAY